MKTPQAISELLETPMDRKQFLQRTAAAMLFISGGGALVHSIGQAMLIGQGKPTDVTVAAQNSYGTSAYGGGQAGV